MEKNQNDQRNLQSDSKGNQSSAKDGDQKKENNPNDLLKKGTGTSTTEVDTDENEKETTEKDSAEDTDATQNEDRTRNDKNENL